MAPPSTVTKSPSWRLLELLLLFLATASVAQAVHHHQHGHHHLHELHARAHQHHLHHPRSNYTSLNQTAGGAAELVRQAQAALAEINKERVEHPSFNKYEFRETARDPELAPFVELHTSNSTLKRRQANNGSDDTATKNYRIPPELAEAARIVAESTPQVPTGNHSETAEALRLKYRPQTNDTNKPEPLKTPEGALSIFGDDVAPQNFQPVLQEDAHDKEKRQSGGSSYWMVGMGSQGSSPFGPSGYQVWRNVKDFGAVGDGVTDDTAAINLAISSGGRCGANCGSSTVVPAVVFFPPGTYLVSGEIIMYYNTQLLGDPHNLPTLLAASSFLGRGIIISDVYISDDEQWYINQSNFLRSIRNFKMDIRLANPWNYMFCIHWQVAQGTSLENIEFYMLFDSQVPGNNQQGIYMENGSGGFLGDLTFIGGAFGAYFGNQQFTTSGLVFYGCRTALQVHWDWAWTMHDFVIDSCQQSLVIVGGAGGLHSTGQGVGSVVLADSIIANTPTGIVTSLLAENSTSFLLQNVGFFGVQTAISDSFQNQVLLAGVPGGARVVDSWGFGMVNNATNGMATFTNAGYMTPMPRKPELTGKQYDQMQPNLFTRRRPKYYDVPANKVINVKAFGAMGDGVTDDTAVLNGILQGAANTSSVVFFPFGVYIVRDTLRIPVGSRVIGQSWSQIMGTGSKFADELHPRPVVQVGRPGDAGILEIQDMMFTVKGATAGAIVVQWNVRETTTGSAGLWDTHVRVGGAKGSDLDLAKCPKLTGTVNPNCKAASLLMHLTPGSTAYMENSWIWVADHDLDKVTQDQIDIYAARCLLVESDRAWLWGTASEHCVLYQYQFSNAQNIMMSMIQTESAYFQPTPMAPLPFTTGLFSNDPTFSNCTASSSPAKCAVSWAVRIIDSTSIYMLGAGLYSWYYNYGQACVDTDDCQTRGFEVEESGDIWTTSAPKPSSR